MSPLTNPGRFKKRFSAERSSASRVRWRRAYRSRTCIGGTSTTVYADVVDVCLSREASPSV